MSSIPGNAAPARRDLPQNPSIEHLRNEAKDRLRRLREHAPGAQLAEAQLEVARDYGFPHWRALKAHVDRRHGPGDHGRLTGLYLVDTRLVANNVVAVTAEDGQLFAQETGQPRIALTLSDEGYSVPGLNLRYRFEGPVEGPATALVIERDGFAARATRTDRRAAEDAQAAFARELAEQARPREHVNHAAADLDRHTGWYLFPFGLVIEVRREGARLVAQAAGQQPFEIQPEAPGRFFSSILPAQFVFAPADGGAMMLRLHQNGRILNGIPVSPEAAGAAATPFDRKLAEQERPRTLVQVGRDVLARYPGRYALSASASMLVTLEGDHLFGQVTGQRRFELFPESDTDFFITMVAAQVSFIMGREGRVTHAVVHQHGRDILMVRADDGGIGA